MLSKYRLPGKLAGEKIIEVIRRDIFILVKRIFLFIILIILPVIFFQMMIFIYPNLLNGSISYPAVAIMASAYYLFIWLFFFFSFIDYYLDVWIITNERIIDVEQRGFFSRTISEQRLYRVQDVTSEVHGFFPTIFKYGNVFVQTAGIKQRFFFHEVPHPEKVRDTIIKLIEKNKKKYKIV